MSCSSAARVLPNNFQELANSSGDLLVTCWKPNETMNLAVTGAARTSFISLVRARRHKGDQAIFRVTFPATADITLDFRNGSPSGVALLPADKFPSQLYTTDGVIVSGVLRFVYTGSAWQYIDSTFPA